MSQAQPGYLSRRHNVSKTWPWCQNEIFQIVYLHILIPCSSHFWILVIELQSNVVVLLFLAEDVREVNAGESEPNDYSLDGTALAQVGRGNDIGFSRRRVGCIDPIRTTRGRRFFNKRSHCRSLKLDWEIREKKKGEIRSGQWSENQCVSSRGRKLVFKTRIHIHSQDTHARWRARTQRHPHTIHDIYT